MKASNLNVSIGRHSIRLDDRCFEMVHLLSFDLHHCYRMFNQGLCICMDVRSWLYTDEIALRRNNNKNNEGLGAIKFLRWASFAKRLEKRLHLQIHHFILLGIPQSTGSVCILMNSQLIRLKIRTSIESFCRSRNAPLFEEDLQYWTIS